jgi:hypothetical protein
MLLRAAFNTKLVYNDSVLTCGVQAVIVRSYHFLSRSYFLVLVDGRSVDIRSLQEMTRKLVFLELTTDKGTDPF